jgi:NADPH:quinone reductase-like Zn-dependent oxidoreductase
LLQGQGLYKHFGLPLPNKPAEKPFPVLIYGGSTATGIYAIQFAKASGLTVVTTASPKNFDYLRSVGADAVFDYKSPTCADDIKNFTDGKLEFSWDCTGYGEDICVQAMGGPGKGKLASIEPLSNYPWTLAYDVLGETYIGLGGKLREADPEELEFATMFMEIARGMLSRGELKVIRQTVNKGGMGLEGVLFGINEVRNNRVSAEKLVYTMSH